MTILKSLLVFVPPLSLGFVAVWALLALQRGAAPGR